MHDMLVDSSLVLERAPLIENEDRYEVGHALTLKLYDPDRDRYDWEDPEWQRGNKRRSNGFHVIYLTQGYSMIVSKRDYKRMTTYPDGRPKRWHVKIEYDESGEVVKVYACRRGRGDEPKSVFAHREILNCLDADGDVDHINGCGLDNRRCNLILGPRSHNTSNTSNRRRVNFSLLPGVEIRGVTKDGRQKFGGIRSRRLKKSGPGSVKTFRTKRHWFSQEFPHRWYLKQLEKLSGGRRTWIHAPKSVDLPVFPPLMESEPSARSRKLRHKAVPRERVLESIPF